MYNLALFVLFNYFEMWQVDGPAGYNESFIFGIILASLEPYKYNVKLL